MKIYTPKELNKKEELELETSRDERKIKVLRHEAWVKSEHYHYVLEIIRKWADSQDSIKRYSTDALVKATATEIKNAAILSKKIQLEAEKFYHHAELRTLFSALCALIISLT